MLVTGIAELLNPQYAATKSQKRRCRSPVGQRLFCFFSGELGQLRIHISLVARFGTMVETVTFRVTKVRCLILHRTQLSSPAELEGKMPLAADEV